ncbi:MAG: chemotaxis protein CheW [Candidatus Latescibacterota bacterium]|jgi:purine-binding chemotaxis protein CheW
MNQVSQLLVFLLDHQRYALHLAAVERVVRAAEVTPLPRAPKIVHGVIDLHGRIIPVIDLRRRFGLPAREVDFADRFVIARTPRRRVALAVDAVDGVVDDPGGHVQAVAEILPHLAYVEGVLRLKDGMALVHDLGRFLSLDEEDALDQALALT